MSRSRQVYCWKFSFWQIRTALHETLAQNDGAYHVQTLGSSHTVKAA